MAKTEAHTCLVEGWLVDLGVPGDKLELARLTVQLRDFLLQVVIEVHVHKLKRLSGLSIKDRHVCLHKVLFVGISVLPYILLPVFHVIFHFLQAGMRFGNRVPFQVGQGCPCLLVSVEGRLGVAVWLQLEVVLECCHQLGCLVEKHVFECQVTFFQKVSYNARID